MFGLFKTIASAFFEDNSQLDDMNEFDINPATGLPMMDSNLDVQGNNYGFNNHSSIFSSNSDISSTN